MKRALQIILAIGVFGLCFSGYLTYGARFALRGGPGILTAYPACAYGFLVYLAIVVVAAIGLLSRGGARARARAFGSVI